MDNRSTLKSILDGIYGGGLNEKDLSDVVRKVHQALEDQFYEEPPSAKQQKVLDQLILLADSVEVFWYFDEP